MEGIQRRDRGLSSNSIKKQIDWQECVEIVRNWKKKEKMRKRQKMKFQRGEREY